MSRKHEREFKRLKIEDTYNVQDASQSVLDVANSEQMDVEDEMEYELDVNMRANLGANQKNSQTNFVRPIGIFRV